MPRAERTIDVGVEPESFMEVLVDFERYPDFLPDLVAARVLRTEPDVWEVAFEVELIRTLRYTLRLERDGDASLRWSLVEGLFHANDGSWTLEAIEGGTRATYQIELQIGMFVPGSLVQSLVGRSLPDVLSGFRDRAEGLAGALHQDNQA